MTGLRRNWLVLMWSATGALMAGCIATLAAGLLNPGVWLLLAAMAMGVLTVVVDGIKNDPAPLLFCSTAVVLAAAFDWLTGHAVPDWVSVPGATLILGLLCLALRRRFAQQLN